ncbi:hypothetical protein BBP40_008343 [Aspergillus hancockii]|nr:hypothetical protein BBP40_008343 [Aspergillus hancockii]
MSSLPSPVTAAEKPRWLEAHGKSYVRPLLDQSGVTQDVSSFRYRGSGTSADPYVVVFIANGPINPMNFPQWQKWAITILQACAELALAFASTAYSSNVFEIMRELSTDSWRVVASHHPGGRIPKRLSSTFRLRKLMGGGVWALWNTN